MQNLRVQFYAGLLLAAANNAALAEAQPSPRAPAGATTSPVTVDNFRRAESDLIMGPIVKAGGFGKYVHHGDLYPVNAPIVRCGHGSEKPSEERKANHHDQALL